MGVERRKYKRLAVKLDLSCNEIDSEQGTYAGQTINVGPGGLYFETTNNMFSLGSLLHIEVSIPPTPGELEFGGRISGLGKVVRTSRKYDSANDSAHSERYSIALEFSRPLKLLS